MAFIIIFALHFTVSSRPMAPTERCYSPLRVVGLSLVFSFYLNSFLVLENSANAAGVTCFYQHGNIGFEVFDIALEVPHRLLK